MIVYIKNVKKSCLINYFVNTLYAHAEQSFEVVSLKMYFLVDLYESVNIFCTLIAYPTPDLPVLTNETDQKHYSVHYKLLSDMI